MLKFLLAVTLYIFCCTKLFAQPLPQKNAGGQIIHEYYLQISGIKTRQQVEYLQDYIATKEGVKFFMANRYPVRYFLMTVERSISAIEFTGWLDSNRYTVVYYGEGIKGREQAITLYNKNKAHH